METEKLIIDPLQSHHHHRHQPLPPTTTTATILDEQTRPSKARVHNTFISIILQPFEWLKMLSNQLNPTFILAIFLVYGLSQGFSGHFFKVVSDYYWKDVQKVQPSSVQLFMGFYYLPWIMKPVWGLLTDVFPVRGYKRRPYFIMAGGIGVVAAMVVGMSGNLEVWMALICMVGITAAVAIADVTVDACIAKNSIEMRNLAPDMQSLCGVCSSAGALIGYSTSGFFVHHLGPQAALGLLAIPPAFLILLGFVIYEVKTTTDASILKHNKKVAAENVAGAVRGMIKTIQFPQVWKPSLYMFLALTLSISTHEGQFYWYTDPNAGPAFSQELVGMIYAIGAMASIVGVLIYHKLLKDYPFRNLIFFAQLVYGVSGMLDLVFISRWNLVLGIPDYFFVVLEECVSKIVSRVRWMPMMVLSTRLCPLGIEGTFFALLMSIDSLGSLTAKMGGGLILHVFHVTRTDFTNLWLVVLIRNVLRLGTLAFIFLIPNADHLDDILPTDVLSKSSTEEVMTLTTKATKDYEGLQLVPMKERSEV